MTPEVSPFTGKDLRRTILKQAFRARVGHIGSALSVADIVATVYSDLLRANSPEDPDRDRFLLSKGHASLALYAALVQRGWVASADLETYCGEGTTLGVHPEWQLRGVDFSSGSLGMGASFAAGAALAARMQKSRRDIYVLLSDAECNEGSVWEAAMFAAHHRLEQLMAFIDLNGQQALGYTDAVLAIPKMAERWAGFGWDAVEVDGHDSAALLRAARAPRAGRPRVLVCRTRLGKGVSFMERQIKWHYMPMSDAEFQEALREVEAAP